MIFLCLVCLLNNGSPEDDKEYTIRSYLIVSTHLLYWHSSEDAFGKGISAAVRYLTRDFLAFDMQPSKLKGRSIPKATEEVEENGRESRPHMKCAQG